MEALVPKSFVVIFTETNRACQIFSDLSDFAKSNKCCSWPFLSISAPFCPLGSIICTLSSLLIKFHYLLRNTSGVRFWLCRSQRIRIAFIVDQLCFGRLLWGTSNYCASVVFGQFPANRPTCHPLVKEYFITHRGNYKL